MRQVIVYKVGSTFKCQGLHVDTILAKTAPTDAQMAKYYKLTKSDKLWASAARPIYVDRVVIQKENGNYTVIPMVQGYALVRQ